MFHYTTVRESYSAGVAPLLTYDATKMDQVILGTVKLLVECILAEKGLHQQQDVV